MANTLMRWDPMSEFQTLRTAMDRLFDQSIGRMGPVRGEDLESRTLGLDVVETNDDYIVRAAVPGIDPKDVEITINDDVLTISGKFEEKSEEKEQQYIRQELHYGQFHRSLKLPPTVDVDKSNAKFENGMLELRLPKRPEARARSLKITPQGVIEAEAQGKNGAS
jgi:HSP20 family protein